MVWEFISAIIDGGIESEILRLKRGKVDIEAAQYIGNRNY
jgi:hypothetical protein